MAKNKKKNKKRRVRGPFDWKCKEVRLTSCQLTLLPGWYHIGGAYQFEAGVTSNRSPSRWAD